ncbi:MAG TPA: hypothetical protein VGI60_11515 [Chthoniobacterales bacterium]
MEHDTGGVAVNGQQLGTGAVNNHAIVQDQFPGGEGVDAGDTGGVDRIAILCTPERLTQ